MRKSKYGYLLLALLVTTGLAGTINSTSISNKERKFAINLMKDTKADLLKSVKGLSEKQLNFKSQPGGLSVKQCVVHIALAEKNLWQLVENSLKQPANPEKRAEIKISDDELVKMMEDRTFNANEAECFEPEHPTWKTVNEALEYFKQSRIDHIKYIKNTTEDLRNHVIQTKIGSMDCYQVCLMISSHSNRHTQELNEVIANISFPNR